MYFTAETQLKEYKDGAQLLERTYGDIKDFPKCKHALIPNVRITSRGPNKGRVFLACPVKAPNTACDFIVWITEKEGSPTTINAGAVAPDRHLPAGNETDEEECPPKKKRNLDQADNGS